MRFSPSNVLTNSSLRRDLELLPGSPGASPSPSMFPFGRLVHPAGA
jgi:hypothetical protein